ncbi:hypothetical protein FQA39_LY10739 [Lamprigera yunnana]|nr:hypothetical protein FQA39_LY10739 [Lamprigera yunnana]
MMYVTRKIPTQENETQEPSGEIYVLFCRKLTQVLLCCIVATVLAGSENRPIKKDDPRDKRTLEYNIAHHYNTRGNYRSERRLSHGTPIAQIPQYPLFQPVQKPFALLKKGRLNVSAPPYAVQMEPLVHYSQRDPLYDAKKLSNVAETSNELKSKDLAREHSHNSRISYAYPPVKHVIERPVYIKEPEPIIEIIIKESNITLPPLPTPPVIIPPRKKEQVQVFYVKYKKNPNGYGKDSIIYDKPVPALSPHVPDEHAHIEHPIPKYDTFYSATVPPPPSTTLRAIVKPESESYHADKGIHITFGKTINEQRKRSNDDAKEESAPEPAISHPPQPQGRQFNPYPTQNFSPIKQSSSNVNFDNSQFSRFNSDAQRFQSNFQNPPPANTFKQQSFSINPLTNSQLPSRPATQTFSNQEFQHRTAPSFPSSQFNNQPRQPVPYQPFDQIRSQQQIQFPRTQTHFPINQFNTNTNFHHLQLQNPTKSQTTVPPFQPLPQNTQQRSQQQFSQQQLTQPQFSHHQFNQHVQPQFNIQHQLPQQQQQQNSFRQRPNNPTQIKTELIPSLPKYEQHYSQPTNAPNSNFASKNVQPQNYQQPQQQQLPNPHLQQLQQQQLQQFQQLHQQQFLQNQQNYNTLIQQQQRANNQDSQIFKSSTYQSTTLKPSTTTYTPSTTSSTTPPSTTEARLTEDDLKRLNIELPDEVPDDLREQLLSSGILKNAQISVLDYDKIGDTAISDLPPDQLANFFTAGGGQQIGAASEPKAIFVRINGDSVNKEREVESSDMEESESALSEVKVEAPVEMKVVHFDPKTEEGQKVPQTYIEDGATQIDPVSLDDQQYNRYLPVKVNGAAFPIPDVPELKGRSISSVVVLAPVDLSAPENQRRARDVNDNNRNNRQLAADALTKLIKNPSQENFKEWLDKENKTVADKQSVILLVTGDSQRISSEKEIFMYDLSTQTVSKLSGELSSAFVDAAETNSQQASTSVAETRVSHPAEKKEFHSGLESDTLSEASEQSESFVDISGKPVQEDLLIAAGDSSGYSETGPTKLFSN